jgi:hypothetical protein
MTENDEVEYGKVPSDFPRPVHLGAIPGGQPKLLVTIYQDKFYAPGCTPPEIYERWQICELIAQELSIKSNESKVGKRSHMSESEILEQYFPRLIKTRWTSEAEARWVIRRVAHILNWPDPPSIAMKS